MYGIGGAWAWLAPNALGLCGWFRRLLYSGLALSFMFFMGFIEGQVAQASPGRPVTVAWLDLPLLGMVLLVVEAVLIDMWHTIFLVRSSSSTFRRRALASFHPGDLVVYPLNGPVSAPCLVLDTGRGAEDCCLAVLGTGQTLHAPPDAVALLATDRYRSAAERASFRFRPFLSPG